MTGYCHQTHGITINISLIQYFSGIFASFSTVSSCVNAVFTPKHPRGKIPIELISRKIAPIVDLAMFACKELPRSKINVTEEARRCVYTYDGNLKFYRFGIRFQLGSYKSSVKWRMAILLREMRWRWWYMYSKSSSWDWLAFYLFPPFLYLPLPPVLFNRWNTRRASSFAKFYIPFPVPRVQIKNRFSPTISALIGTARRSKVRYIDAVKLILQKSVPEEVHLMPIKRPSYAPASALVFLGAFSLLPFESKEPFIEENHFNVPFDVTAAVAFFALSLRNHGG